MLWVDVSHYMVHSTKQKAVEKKESVLMVHDIYIISLSLSPLLFLQDPLSVVS